MECAQNEEQGGWLSCLVRKWTPVAGKLETTTDFKAKKAYEGVNLECVKDKYVQILNIFVSIYSKKEAENIFSTLGEFFTKDRIAPKIKQLDYKYKKTLDLGKQIGAGRPNRYYFLHYREDREPLSHSSLE